MSLHSQSVSSSSARPSPVPPPPLSSTSSNAASTSDSNPLLAMIEPLTKKNQTEQYHSEDRLLRTWRSIESSVVVAAGKATKVTESTTKDRALLQELDDSVVAFYKVARMEWGRLLSYIEATLEGKAKELEIKQHFSKTHSKLGRKRKRSQDETATLTTTTSAVVTNNLLDELTEASTSTTTLP